MAARVVEILITGNSTQAVAEIEKVAAASEASAKSASASFLGIGKAATLGLAAVAIGVAAIGVKLAEEGEVATARLKKAVDNAGLAWSQYGSKVDEAKSKSRDLGFSGGDVSESLTKLVNVTKDSTKSLADLTLAEDVARGRKIDLATATDLLVKVESGHVALLGRLGINVKDATGHIISQEAAVKKLSEMYGGQASAYADTFQGKLAVIAAQAKYLVAQIGVALIPVIEKLGDVLISSVEFLEKHKAAAIALGVAVGGPLVAAMTAWIATQVIAAGSSLASFWGTLIGRAGLLLSAFEATDVALAQNTAQMMIAAGATEAEVAAIMQLDEVAGTSAVGLAGMTAGVAVAAAAFVAMGVVIDDFIGTGGKFQAVTDAMKEGEREGSRWAMNQIAASHAAVTNVDKVNQLKLSLIDLKGQLAAQVELFHQGGLTAEQAAKAWGTYEGASKSLRSELEKLKAQQIEADAELAAMNADLGKITAGTLAFRDASDKARKAVYDLQDALFGQTDASIAYQKSQDDVKQGEEDLAAAIRDHGSASKEAEDAEKKLRDAKLHSAEAGSALTKQNDELYNKIKTEGQSAFDAEMGRLKDLQAQYPENAAQYQDEIDKFQRIKDQIYDLQYASGQPLTFTFDIHRTPGYEEGVAQIQSLIGNPQFMAGVTPYGGGRAIGGPVMPGTAYTVGENGPETLVMGSTGGNVIPSSGGAGGGVTVNVYGSVLTEGQLVDAIVTGINRKAEAGPVLIRTAIRS